MTRLALAAALMLSACSASAGEDTPYPETEMTDVMEQTCQLSADFSQPSALEPWRIVNDGVMGGKSQGTRFHEDGAMVFAGTIITDGGGFSSLRAGLRPGTMAGGDGLRLKVRSDGRAYKMTFRTSERWRGRSVSYQKPIPQTPAGEWADVTVPFKAMDTSVFGRTVRAADFDPSDAREIGIILADGIDGPFRLEVASIACMDGG
jgi:hypothetical protein